MTYTEPLLLLFLGIALAGLLLGGPSKGKRIALAGVLGLFLLCWPPADWLASRPLEAPYPVRPFRPPPGIQAVVVLGSGVEPIQLERPYPLASQDTFRRSEYAAWIYKQWGPLPVLACEGKPPLAGESPVMRDLLIRSGVAENLIWTENQSRTTHENAVFGSEILRAHGIQRVALVVEARSMPRAAACFRKEGIDVIPAPSGFRTWGLLQDEALPTWKAVRENEITLHETLGLLWYRLRGWI